MCVGREGGEGGRGGREEGARPDWGRSCGKSSDEV